MTDAFRGVSDLVGGNRDVREVAGGTAMVFLLRVLGVGLSFGFNVLLARLLGAEGAGIYYLAFTVTSIATVVGRVGLDNALLRFTAADAAQEDWAGIAGLYRQGMRIAMGASAAATVFVIGSSPWIAGVVFSDPALANPLRLMALAILPMSVLMLHGEFLKALKKFRDAVFVQGLGIPLVSILLLFPLTRSLGVVGAVGSYVVATLLLLLLGWAFWRRATPQLRGLRGNFDARLLIATSTPLFWVALMSLLMTWTDTIMLGIWTDSESVGIYSVAKRTAVLTSLILVSANSVVSPKFAELYAQGNLRALGTFARSAARFMTFLALLPLLVFTIFPVWILGLFGSGFGAGAEVLVILSIGQFVNVAAGSIGPLLIMSGHERVLKRIVVFSSVVNLILNALLVSGYGMVGAAVASSISIVLMNILCLYAVRKYLRISLLSKKYDTV